MCGIYIYCKCETKSGIYRYCKLRNGIREIIIINQGFTDTVNAKLNQGKIFSGAIERHEEEDSRTQAGAPPLIPRYIITRGLFL